MTEINHPFDPVPALVCYNNLEQAVNRGTVVLYHGFWGQKENHRDLLFRLAEEGFVAVGLDNVDHGERRAPDFEERYSDRNPRIEENFLTAVLGTARELPAVVDGLIQRGWAREDLLGVAGISMGGYIAYTAITLEPRIRAAACVVGSPRYRLDWEQSPHRHLDRFERVCLLSQNAALDTVVPTAWGREFHQELAKLYPDHESRFRYREYPESGHMMEPRDWNASMDELVAWFHRHL